jgi:hypothetical protein
MSLRINKDNIIFVLPESRYAVSERIDTWMDEDFTLHVTAKVFPEELTEKESFIFARNGMHSGISAFKDSYGNCNVVFTYWFKKLDGTMIPKQIIVLLKENELNDFNEYTMICDHFNDKNIKCYFNGFEVGTIEYDNDEKTSYKNCFYWFGCGSMIGGEEHAALGDYEYKLAFVLNKTLDILDAQDIIDTYYDKHSHIIFDNNMRKLNYDHPLRNNFAFLCDFKNSNRYKVWDISFSGNYPQFYIEKNIYF